MKSPQNEIKVPPIVIRTKLLAAIAKFASSDDLRPHICVVAFTPDEIQAVNGHVLVRVTRDSYTDELAGGPSEAFSISRTAIEMAVAAQDVVPREYKSRQIAIQVDGDFVNLELSPGHAGYRATLRVAKHDASTFPPVDKVMPGDPLGVSPVLGIGLSSRYLADLDDLLNAGGWAGKGVRIDSWGSQEDPVLLSCGPVRALIMPVRQ